MNIELMSTNFEQIEYYTPRRETAEHLGAVALGLADKVIKLRAVERVPRYADGERENDVEHSFMLSVIAPELAAALELKMDYSLIGEFAKVHEFLEIKTGDIATFDITSDALAAKKQQEETALPKLLAELPPYTAGLLARYEAQAEPEARFVKFVDKLLPAIVDILGLGERIMHEDYNVHTSDQLRAAHKTLDERWSKAFGSEFSDILDLHRVLTELFEEKFVRTTLQA